MLYHTIHTLNVLMLHKKLKIAKLSLLQSSVISPCIISTGLFYIHFPGIPLQPLHVRAVSSDRPNTVLWSPPCRSCWLFVYSGF